jgi:hypothetical protein
MGHSEKKSVITRYMMLRRSPSGRYFIVTDDDQSDFFPEDRMEDGWGIKLRKGEVAEMKITITRKKK